METGEEHCWWSVIMVNCGDFDHRDLICGGNSVRDFQANRKKAAAHTTG